VGGAYKNKLPFPYLFTSGTVKGVEVTVYNDGRVRLVGTPTDRIDLVLFQDVAPSNWNGAKFNGNTLPADKGVLLIQERGGSWTNYCNSVYSGHEEVISNIPTGTTVWAFIRLFANGAIDTVIEPMISTEGGTFAPYSNICPISGRDSVVLTRSDGDEISENFTIQLGQTVYGADINWDTGVMTVNKGFQTLVGASGEN
jgi:hypothetical protein